MACVGGDETVEADQSVNQSIDREIVDLLI
jgi:hypothetical protein